MNTASTARQPALQRIGSRFRSPFQKSPLISILQWRKNGSELSTTVSSVSIRRTHAPRNSPSGISHTMVAFFPCILLFNDPDQRQVERNVKRQKIFPSKGEPLSENANEVYQYLTKEHAVFFAPIVYSLLIISQVEEFTISNHVHSPRLCHLPSDSFKTHLNLHSSPLPELTI